MLFVNNFEWYFNWQKSRFASKREKNLLNEVQKTNANEKKKTTYTFEKEELSHLVSSFQTINKTARINAATSNYSQNPYTFSG